MGINIVWIVFTNMWYFGVITTFIVNSETRDGQIYSIALNVWCSFIIMWYK